MSPASGRERFTVGPKLTPYNNEAGFTRFQGVKRINIFRRLSTNRLGSEELNQVGMTTAMPNHFILLNVLAGFAKHLMYKSKYCAGIHKVDNEAKQPLSPRAKWLLIKERETRFELATLSLGS